MIMNSTVFLFILVNLFSIHHNSVSSYYYQKNTDWICVPGKKVGYINKNATENELRRKYYSQSVKREKINVGENEWVVGTILFPDSKNELQIIWNDTIDFKNPNRIYIRNKETQWRIDNNFTIGSSIKEVEKINGKDFFLLGFGWDYAGTVIDWNKGELDAVRDFLTVRFDGDSELKKMKVNDSHLLQGDKKIHSSNPTIQKLNPKIYEIIIHFD